MELRLAERIIGAITECGEDVKLYVAYRGRGLGGKETTGVVCDSFATIIKCIINCADFFCDGEEHAEFNITNLREDSLGSRVIIY